MAGNQYGGGLDLSLESLGVNLPYNMEAEQAVLGAAILEAEIIPQMVENLRPEMFYARQNGEIFSFEIFSPLISYCVTL